MNAIMDTPQSTEILTLLNRIDAKLGGGLAEFRVEVATRFEAVDARFDAMDVRFDGIDKRLDAMDVRFDAMDRRFDAMDVRFDGIDRRLDAMGVRFDGIDKRLDAMDVRFDGVDRKIEAWDRRLDRKIDGLRTELVDHMERIHVELDLRLQDVEPRQPKARAK
jgi:archaellum component FlaC